MRVFQETQLATSNTIDRIPFGLGYRYTHSYTRNGKPIAHSTSSTRVRGFTSPSSLPSPNYSKSRCALNTSPLEPFSTKTRSL